MGARDGRTRKGAHGRTRSARAAAPAAQRWSQRVTAESNALDLEPGVFTKRTPRAVALSLQRSAESSRRRKASPFQSAMSMLTFYVNRAGANLPKAQLAVLERAKDELRRLYGRPARSGGARTRRRAGRVT